MIIRSPRLRPSRVGFAALFTLVTASVSTATEWGNDALARMSLEEILALPIGVASLSERPVSEAPGIVSILTREEIESSGARTLDDLLLFIPGLTPGQDDQNTRGYGVRGLWGMEGKVLVQLDGVPLNEPLYGNTVFAHQFSVDLIERLEIIRGPASAVFGEFGELAVLNLVTRSTDQTGGTVRVTHGQTDGTVLRRVASAGWSGAAGPARLALNGSIGGGQLGTGRYTDKYGESYSAQRFSGQDFWWFNSTARWNQTTLRLLGSSLDQEQHVEGDYYGSDGTFVPGPSRPLSTSFGVLQADLTHHWTISRWLSLEPHLNLARSDSWRKSEEWIFSAVDDPYDVREWFRDFPHRRFTGGTRANLGAGAGSKLVLGAEWSHESIDLRRPSIAADDPWDYYYFYGDDTTHVSTTRRSFFGEFDLHTRWINVTLGGRIDKHPRFAAATLPRLALTRDWGPVYAKAMASRAYHPPTLMTTAWLDPEIEPEYATELDAELGYHPRPGFLARVNLFTIRMDPVILYSGQFSNTEARSQGVETEIRLEGSRGRLTASYSHHRAHYDDPEDTMALTEDGTLVENVTLGFPAHKGTLQGTLHLSPTLSVSPGLAWFSRRYVRSAAYFWDGSDYDYNPKNESYDPALLANCHLRAHLPGGWDASVGIWNLTGERYPSATGSYLGNPPLPGPGRELVLKLGYDF